MSPFSIGLQARRLNRPPNAWIPAQSRALFPVSRFNAWPLYPAPIILLIGMVFYYATVQGIQMSLYSSNNYNLHYFALLISLSSLRWQCICRRALRLMTFPAAVVGCTRQALYTADRSNPGLFNVIPSEIVLPGPGHNWLGDPKSQAARLVALRWAPVSGSVDICSTTVRGGYCHA
jgi:hypothetical protein